MPLALSFAFFAMPAQAVTSEASVSAISSLNAGNAALQSGRSLEAVEYLNAAIESGALSAEGLSLAYHHRGIAHQKLNLTGHAVADYTNAIWQGGLPVAVLPRSYYNRAVAYAQMGQMDRAEQDYNKTIELQPDYAAAFHNRGNLRRNLGRHAEAVGDYTKALDLGMADGTHLTYFARALSNKELGSIAEAIQDAQLALNAKPDFPVAKSALAEWGPVPSNSAIASRGSQNVTPAPVDPIVTASLTETNQKAEKPVVAAPPVDPISASTESVRAPGPQNISEPAVSPQTAGNGQALTLLPPQVAAIEPQTGNVTVNPLSEALPPARGEEGWTPTITRFQPASSGVGEQATASLANDGYTRGRAAVPATPAQRNVDGSLTTASIDAAAPTPAIGNGSGSAEVAGAPVQVAQNHSGSTTDAGNANPPAAGPRAQIGAFRSAADATGAWDKIVRKHGAVIGQHQPYIAEADLGARGIFYRLQIGGFTTSDEVKSVCSALKSAGQDCLIVR